MRKKEKREKKEKEEKKKIYMYEEKRKNMSMCKNKIM
jgi:hypothetical protein